MARPQTELNIGQLNLSPTVQGAGKNQVFVAPLPRQNRAQMLAKNLAQFSTVLGQYSNIQAKRAEEKALQLTNQEVIDQVESNLPEKFNPFNKITFDKVFSEKRYDRYYDLEIKDQVQQMAFEIKRAGPDKIGDKGFLQDIITDGLAKIDENVLEYIGDNVHMLNRHKEVMGQVSAGMRFNENSKFEKGQVEWLKSASVESFDIKVAEGVEHGMLKEPKGARRPLLDGWISTFYGLESIDKVTAEDQIKADRGEPGYEGFSQTVGASGRKLVPGYSVASNYFPQGTLLNITFEGEDKPSIYRVDDIGGMDTDKKIDFFAGEDKKLKEKFRLGKIKDVEYAETKADDVTKSMTQVLQNLVTEGDKDLYNNFNHDPVKRVDLLRAGLISSALVEREKGNIDKSDAILESLPNLLLDKGQKLFGSTTGKAAYEDALNKADAIDLKNEENNSKIIAERASVLNQIYTNDTISLLADPDKEIITLEEAANLEVIDEREQLIDNQLRDLNLQRDEAVAKDPNSLEVKVLNEAVKSVMADQAKHDAKILGGGQSLLEGSNAFERYENAIAIRLGAMQQRIFENKELEGKIWKENESSYAPELIDKNLLKNLYKIEQTDFYDRNVEAIGRLIGVNPTIPENKLQPEINRIVSESAKKSLEIIGSSLDNYMNEFLPKQSEVAPTDTQFEEQRREAKRSGLTEKEAKETALATTLKGDETFNIIDERGKQVKIDVSKPSKGLFNIGNYEEEDLEEYNLLFNNTKATGAFKGNETAVDEFVKNRKTILKEGDFFIPLVTKYNKYVNPSSDFYSFTPLDSNKNLTDIEFQTTRLAIEKRLITNGVLAEDAEKGDILGYPLKKLIQRNWKTMSVINLDTNDVDRRAIWTTNLREDHKVPNKKTGLDEDQEVTFKEFIEAQEKLIKDQTK